MVRSQTSHVFISHTLIVFHFCNFGVKKKFIDIFNGIDGSRNFQGLNHGQMLKLYNTIVQFSAEGN